MGLPLCPDIVAKVENRTTQKSRQSRSRGFSAAASLVSATTEARDRFWVKRYGPSRRRAQSASAALRIFVRHPKSLLQQYPPRSRHRNMDRTSAFISCPLSKGGNPTDYATERWILELADIFENAFSKPPSISGSGEDPAADGAGSIGCWSLGAHRDFPGMVALSEACPDALEVKAPVGIIRRF